MAIKHLSIPNPTQQDVDRFWNKVKILSNGCWIWTGTLNKPGGYGVFMIQRKKIRSHRLAYRIYYGVDPGEYDVLHRCDNTICVNPLKLFLGDAFDNMRDMVAKGRGTGKLSFEIAAAIRERYEQGGITHRQLAKQFSVCSTQIHRILHGKRLGTVTKRPRLTNKMTVEAVHAIRAMRADGATNESVAAQFGISRTQVSRIVNRQRWKHI
jgi:antitoxin component HigA of HigAB toxin-antitoxin module